MSNLNFILVFVKFKLRGGGNKSNKKLESYHLFPVNLPIVFQIIYNKIQFPWKSHKTYTSFLHLWTLLLRLSYSLMRRLCFFSVFHHLELFLALGSLYSFPLLLIQLIKNNHYRALSLTFHYFLKCHLLTG